VNKEMERNRGIAVKRRSGIVRVFAIILSFFFIVAGLPQNTTAHQCCDPCWIFPGWLRDVAAKALSKSTELFVSTASWCEKTGQTIKNYLHPEEEIARNRAEKEKSLKELKKTLEEYSNEENLEEAIISDKTTPEHKTPDQLYAELLALDPDAQDFMANIIKKNLDDVYVRENLSKLADDTLKALATGKLPFINQLYIEKTQKDVGELKMAIDSQDGLTPGQIKDLIGFGTSLAPLGPVAPLVNLATFSFDQDCAVAEGKLAGAELEDCRAAHNRWAGQNGISAAIGGYKVLYDAYQKSVKPKEDELENERSFFKRLAFKKELDGSYDTWWAVRDSTAESFLKAANGIDLEHYLPAAGYGDWDPEWEETWIWEGDKYPQTDVNYENYPYVDERGAYDWS
jgi:hypothetical protein